MKHAALPASVFRRLAVADAVELFLVNEVYFIDAARLESGRFAPAVRPGLEVLMLDPGEDTPAQIGAPLTLHRNLAALHQGEPGAPRLGATRFAVEAVKSRSVTGWDRAATGTDATRGVTVMIAHPRRIPPPGRSPIHPRFTPAPSLAP